MVSILFYFFRIHISYCPLFSSGGTMRKNDIDSTTASSGSHARAWWLDSNDNSYQMTIYKKCMCGQGSPFDAGKKIAPGNSLADLYPELAKQWNYEKNGDLTPYDITTGSSRKIWWICPETGKIWKASPKSRVESRHYKSPYMTNRVILKGVNDLATCIPDVGKEVSPNNDLTAHQLSPYSSKKAIWRCSKCDHEWITRFILWTIRTNMVSYTKG